MGRSSYQAVEKHHLRHCEERFLRRGNPELIDFYECEIASLRSQRRLKDFFNSLLMLENGKPRIFSRFFFLSRKVKSDYNGCSNNQQAENVGDVPDGLVQP